MAVRQIKPAELGRFSIDEDTNRLYWDNKAVQTESVVVLSAKQTFWGIIIAIATVLGAVATCVYTWTYVRVTRETSTAKPVQVKTQESLTPLAPCPAPAAETVPPAQSRSLKQTSPKKRQ